MAIFFDEKKQQFYLNTANTSYIIELLDKRIPINIYWGSLLRDMPSAVALRYMHPGNLSVHDVDCGYTFASSYGLPAELPCYGTGDMREPAFHAVYSDGSRISNFEYKSHEIINGKPELSGLPATYGNEDEVSTLLLSLEDQLTGVSVCLQYSVFEQRDVITRSMKIINGGSSEINVLKAASASVDFYDSDFEVVSLHGDWAREFQLEKNKVPYGVLHFDSKCGKSGHFQNPLVVMAKPDATETYGEVYGVNLVYSGNFDISVEKNAIDIVRLQAGINSFDFSWKLKSGESFQTPEAVLVYSDEGLGGMSRKYHSLYRNNLCRGEYKKKNRPILINNWEATYWDFTEEKIIEIAEKAHELGIEMLVLDDGWFGERNSDNSSLGDWFCNTKKLSSGLKGLADKLKDIGMQFGIWVEPEMVSPDSNLYRAHPDWCIHVENRARNLSRNQLVLDFSREDVREYIISAIRNILKSADITYVKWDMNRCISDWGSAKLPADRQQELSYRYVLGLYEVLESLTTEFPDVLFENCSSGGGRFDPGMLYYMPQTWCSDDSDAVERVYIQYGASMSYPVCTIGAHISACPNHQVNRRTPLKMRGDVAMSGQLGYELDLTKITEEESLMIANQINFYREYREVILWGDMYRIASPFENGFAAWQFISEDKSTAILCTYILEGKPGVAPKRFKMQALEKDAVYENVETGEQRTGAFLMNVGVARRWNSDYLSQVSVFRKI